MWTFNIPPGGKINLLFPTVTNTSTLCCFICRQNWLLQNFRAAEKTENHPHTIICMHQKCRALGHLCSLNIPLSLLTFSKPSGSVLCSHLEMSHIEVIKSKGCIKSTGSFWTESCNCQNPRVLYSGPTCSPHWEDKAALCGCSGQSQSKSSCVTKATEPSTEVSTPGLKPSPAPSAGGGSAAVTSAQTNCELLGV